GSRMNKCRSRSQTASAVGDRARAARSSPAVRAEGENGLVALGSAGTAPSLCGAVVVVRRPRVGRPGISRYRPLAVQVRQETYPWQKAILACQHARKQSVSGKFALLPRDGAPVAQQLLRQGLAFMNGESWAALEHEEGVNGNRDHNRLCCLSL